MTRRSKSKYSGYILGSPIISNWLFLYFYVEKYVKLVKYGTFELVGPIDGYALS